MANLRLQVKLQNGTIDVVSKDQKGSIIIPLVVVIILLILGVLARNIWQSSQNPMVGTIQSSLSLKTSPVTFTHPIFDPDLVSNITPLGELMGGYEEATALAGVVINLKPESYGGGKDIEVRAPTDMTLQSYAYFLDINDGSKNWALIFRLSPELTLRFDHITRVSQKIANATTAMPKNTSAEDYPKDKILIKAGEVFAYTSGTSLAHNWNIYLTDTRQQNPFLNLERYKTSQAGQRLLNSRCPFDLYPQDLKQTFLKIMGYSKPGQSSDCGNPSKDVLGTLSGMWHFSPDPKTGIAEQMDGIYASPLSVFKNSAGQVTIDQVNNQRLDIEPENELSSTRALVKDNKTNKDPKEITGEHCYQLSSGYAYFKVISDTQMQFAYGNSTCPLTFPASQAKTYYR